MPHQFYDLTPREFDNLLKAAKQLAESEYKQEWELARYQAYYTLKPYLDKKDQTKSIKEIVALPWDAAKELPVKPTKKEDAAAFWARADKLKTEK